MNTIIDPHVHLFNLEEGHYFWLKPDQAPDWPNKQKINRTYLESDLDLGERAQIAGFVHIEAGFDNDFPEREIEWLEKHCNKPFRSIAYTDLSSEDAEEQLDKLRAYSSVVGIRHILDGQASELLSDPHFKNNLALLAEHGLIFEAQLPLSDAAAVHQLSLIMTDLPSLKVVINHCGLPVQLDEAWMNSIIRLAHHSECYIKCSGWEMFSRDWTCEVVKPLISFAIRQFGLTRVMLASNFPVCELSANYGEVWQRNYLGMKWKGFEKNMLCYENAQRIYQIPAEQ